MSLYVLDTDILSFYQLGDSNVCRRVEEHQSDDLAVTIITVEEQLSGWYTLRRRVKGRERIARVYDRFTENVRFLSRLHIVSFSEEAIDRFYELLRMKLGVKGKRPPHRCNRTLPFSHRHHAKRVGFQPRPGAGDRRLVCC